MRKALLALLSAVMFLTLTINSPAFGLTLPKEQYSTCTEKSAQFLVDWLLKGVEHPPKHVEKKFVKFLVETSRKHDTQCIYWGSFPGQGEVDGRIWRVVLISLGNEDEGVFYNETYVAQLLVELPNEEDNGAVLAIKLADGYEWKHYRLIEKDKKLQGQEA